MKLKIIKITNHEQSVDFEVELDLFDFASQVKKTKEKIYKSYSLTGFRKGHVPSEIVDKHINKESVLYQTLYVLNEKIVHKIIDLEIFANSKALDTAIGYQIVELGDNKTIAPIVKVTFEKVPKILNFTKKDFEQIITKTDLEKITPKKDKIQEQIKQMLKKHVVIVPKSQQIIANGDFVNIDFVGFVGDQAIPNGASKNYELEIGSKTFIGDFEQQLINLKKGDKKEIHVQFPTNYSNKNYAGKKAKFNVTINAVKTTKFPTLTKDLIEKEFNLRNIDNETSLINYFEKMYFENNLLKKVNDVIINKAKIDYYPRSLIKLYMQKLLTMEEQKIKNYGFSSLDEYLKKVSSKGNEGFNKTKDEYYNRLLDVTKKHILIGIVYENLIDQYGLDINDQDKKNFVKDKLLYHYDNEKIAIDELNKNEVYYKSIILKNKLLDIILKK